MKILLVIAHPAHVHFFKNIVREMREEGHEFMLMVKERENTTQILDLLGFDYETFGKTYPSRVGKAFGVMHNDMSLLRKTKKFEPDLTASIGGLYSVHCGSLLDVPSIDFMDTENAHLTNFLTFPYATVIATPDCYTADVPKSKHLTYRGYHELAYLHPKRYKPDKSILDEMDLTPCEYTVVRYSSFDASHQRDEQALTRREKIDIVRMLSKHGTVLVDSEESLPEPIEHYKLDIPDHRFHDLLAYSKLYVGEGATTASEAGVLGVPWIYISNKNRCYLDDQEIHYDMGVQTNNAVEAMDTAKAILNGDVDMDFKEARRRLIKNKIDVTAWMKRLFEHFS